ncbi:MAG: family 78 glycoside hydrolase catalytic domain [Verrucomicrobiota bacterium JB022]|nr:family 78 glycoside hydrolase catalytic domain [Verrucomicrobiota bacterium JB022]
MKLPFLIPASAAASVVFLASPALALEPYALTAEAMRNPLGLDASPTLSWKLKSDTRGDRQTAYQVLVASSADKLAADEGDLWDSGQKEGEDQIFVRYRGSSIGSGQEAFWKVRVWDADGEPGDWSETATWTMGLKSQNDWEASWIASPEWLKYDRPHLGYRSQPADDVNTPKWIQLDLGKTYTIDQIKLHGLRHTVSERLGLPQAYVIELANKPDFSDAKVVADTRDAPINMWISRHTIPVEQVKGRYFRLKAPVLRELNDEICLAFSQIEVNSKGQNVAIGAKVTASDSLEEGPWSASAVVDGKGLSSAFPLATETVIAREDFQVRPQLKRAVVFVSGQGQYTLEINGERVGDYAITPGWTDAEKTVLYDTFDVTDLVKSGANAMGLTLSSGMYNVAEPEGRYTKLVGRYRPLTAILQLQLEYEDGSKEVVTTNDDWAVRSGPTTYSHMYGGEVYDARLEPAGWTQPGFKEDSSWQAAAETKGPGGKLRGASYAAPAVKVIETLEPVAQKELEPGKVVYDLGQNAALMVRVKVKGPAGSMVRVEPSELVHEDGRIDPGSTRAGLASWDYILDGKGEESWQANYFYHGARYLQVTTTPAKEGGAMPEVIEIEGLVTHGSAEPVGEFATSSELWTKTRELIRWAQRSNMVSVLTDCPHRERLGWLEQYHLNGPSLRYEFDVTSLYRKTFGDMADAQTERGLVPSTSPEFVVMPGDFRDSPEWGSSLVLAAWQQYLYTGDETAFKAQYNQMQAYEAYLASKAEGHILDHGLGDWYDIGPGAPGYGKLTPRALTATAIYYELCRELGKISQIRGRVGEATAYAERAEHIRKAFNDKFFNADTGSYATGSQTANAMPYALGMVPKGREADVFAAIVKSIEASDYSITAGDVGHRYLLRALALGNRPDLVYKIHHRTDVPGYGWQVEHGKTSLTEAWDGGSSQNHFMLGHLNEWFYRSLVGIAPDPEAPGFKHIIIRPEPVEELSWAEATHDGPYGPIHVRWEQAADTFTLDVEVPPGSTATVHLPKRGDTLLEGGKPLAQVQGVTLANQDAETATLEVGSGHYTFVSTSRR